MITLLGKQHLSGTSKKTNKDYSFNVLHLASDEPLNSLEGKQVYNSNCSDDFFTLYDVGTNFKAIFYDKSGLVIGGELL
ncbi:MAG: hypothetical protein ACI4II_02355 [Acutalibacteraceae bacterium]